MAKKSKVRFYARLQDGGEGALLSAEDARSGDLNIYITRSAYAERSGIQNPDDMGALKHEKITVHRSDRAEVDGHTITYTLVAEGHEMRAYAFIHNLPDRPFVWLLFARRYPEVSHPMFRLKRGTDAQCVRVAEYDDRANNLMLAAIVTAKGIDITAAFPGHRVTTQQFASFDLHLVAVYLRTFSWSKGDTVFANSSGPGRGDPESEANHLISIPLIDLGVETARFFSILLSRFKERINFESTAAPPRVRIVARLHGEQAYWSPEPGTEPDLPRIALIGDDPDLWDKLA